MKKSEEMTESHRVRDYFEQLLDMRSDMLSYDELHSMMKENIVIRGANMWILMMAILIASIGLNTNSTAVIIGAMLISPLMGGILTMGYSLATHDLPLLKQAAACFATQVAISLVASTAYFTLSPLTTATDEMIARTSPTLWDVLIALFGGIAGGIGNTRKKASNVIPGVAIATALMPPLCTVGYGIATRQSKFVLGALYLFIINTLFIGLSALIVTKLLGVPCLRELDEKRQKRANRNISILIVIIVIPSILTGALTVYKSVVEGNVSRYLESEFAFDDAQVVQSSSDNVKKVISVSLVGKNLTDAKIEKLEKKLADYGLGGYALKVTQDKVNEDADKIAIAMQKDKIRKLRKRLKNTENENDGLKDDLSDYAALEDLSQKTEEVFVKLKNVHVGIMEGGAEKFLLMTADERRKMSEDEVEAVRNFLIEEGKIADVRIKIEK